MPDYPQPLPQYGFLARQNPDSKPVDFGSVRTAGGGRLVRQDKSLRLIPLPDSGSVRTRFELRWDRLPWQLPKPTQVEVVAEDGRCLRRTAVGQTLAVECEPEVFAYRLVAE